MQNKKELAAPPEHHRTRSENAGPPQPHPKGTEAEPTPAVHKTNGGPSPHRQTAARGLAGAGPKLHTLARRKQIKQPKQTHQPRPVIKSNTKPPSSRPEQARNEENRLKFASERPQTLARIVFCLRNVFRKERTKKADNRTLPFFLVSKRHQTGFQYFC